MLVLVGTKCDLIEERQVTVEEIAKFAEKQGLPYFETSAKDNKNIHETFQYILDNLVYD